MARKRTKEEAKDRIPRFPNVPPVLVPSLGPLAPFYVVGKSAEIIADALIDIDPLDRLASVVNDPSIQVAPEMVEIINDPNIVMTKSGEVVRSSPNGRETIRRSGQFSRQNLLPRLPGNSKRARKKTKTDKNMSKALSEANSRLRTKTGKLRKGKTQGDVMRLAHRLRKKMR